MLPRHLCLYTRKENVKQKSMKVIYLLLVTFHSVLVVGAQSCLSNSKIIELGIIKGASVDDATLLQI